MRSCCFEDADVLHTAAPPRTASHQLRHDLLPQVACPKFQWHNRHLVVHHQRLLPGKVMEMVAALPIFTLLEPPPRCCHDQ